MVAIGDVDEANSAIGVAIVTLDAASPLAGQLRMIQNEMFDLGADIATPFGTDFEQHALRIVARQVSRLEEEIDAMNANLSPLTSFILPGGSAAVASIPPCACDRPPRRTHLPSRLPPRKRSAFTLFAYLNRLSDHLFVAARFTAAAEGGDVLWQPGATRNC
jgi:cob(I)alamin adenosyltransferase